MSLKITLLAGALALAPSLALAHMQVSDPYARSSSPVAISGAAFMTIFNHSNEDDRLVSARSNASERVELHTHVEEENGVLRMVHIEEGFDIPAGETITLSRGGMHVMFLGLTEPMEQGDQVVVTLEFEKADPVTVLVPVDLERQPAAGAHGGHGDHGAHGAGHGAHGEGHGDGHGDGHGAHGADG